MKERRTRPLLAAALSVAAGEATEEEAVRQVQEDLSGLRPATYAHVVGRAVRQMVEDLKTGRPTALRVSHCFDAFDGTPYHVVVEPVRPATAYDVDRTGTVEG